jgi:hypothetical protein
MRVLDSLNGLLALTSEKGEDGGTLCNSSLALCCDLDSLFTKASGCMVLEVGCRGLVLQILIVLNSTSSGLALLGGTWKEVAHTAFIILNRDTIRLEETVYWGTPTLFQDHCNVWP